MGMRENNRARRDGRKQVEPIRPAIDHDAGVIVPDEQRTVTPMETGTNLDFAARTKEYQFKYTCYCWHFVPGRVSEITR
jgi:hypothetical protein